MSTPWTAERRDLIAISPQWQVHGLTDIQWPGATRGAEP
jgi:hypothetical protein